MIIYINAYAVTRHYGGPEEGGWWYNQGEPIASVPLETERLDACPTPDSCRCRWNNNGIVTKDEHPNWQEADPENGLGEPPPHAHYKLDMTRVNAMREHLEKTLSDVKEGNIYSVLGGTDVVVCVEEYFATPYPSKTPHYE